MVELLVPGTTNREAPVPRSDGFAIRQGVIGNAEPAANPQKVS